MPSGLHMLGMHRRQTAYVKTSITGVVHGLVDVIAHTGFGRHWLTGLGLALTPKRVQAISMLYRSYNRKPLPPASVIFISAL